MWDSTNFKHFRLWKKYSCVLLRKNFSGLRLYDLNILMNFKLLIYNLYNMLKIVKILSTLQKNAQNHFFWQNVTKNNFFTNIKLLTSWNQLRLIGKLVFVSFSLTFYMLPHSKRKEKFIEWLPALPSLQCLNFHWKRNKLKRKKTFLF